jgi:hypothetical protein
MDNSATYKMLANHSASPVIALNNRGLKNDDADVLPHGIKGFDSNGVPVCSKDLPMEYWGRSGSKGFKYRCPLAVHNGVADCQCKCSDSPYGRTIYIKPPDDPRLNTPIPRGSKQWHRIYNKRTAAERVNKRVGIDYKLFCTDCRSSNHRAFRTFCACVNIHADVWLSTLPPPTDLLIAMAA